jgi:hypothetical protein
MSLNHKYDFDIINKELKNLFQSQESLILKLENCKLVKNKV